MLVVTAYRTKLLLSKCLQKICPAMGDIAALRISYNPKESLDAGQLPTKDPFQLFNLWFEDARNCDKIVEPNAMTLATANCDGAPSARMVLLKGFGADGFKFYSNYNSRKGSELAENPKAALLFFWEALYRQVRVEGTVEKLSAAESDFYFHSRPHGSQIGACSSNQSKPIKCRQMLLDKYTELETLYPTEDHVVQRPDNWGGYLIVPHTIEFWQGQTNRLHSRVQFTRQKRSDISDDLVMEADNGWFYQILSP